MGYDYSIINRVLAILEYSELDFSKLEKDYLKLKSKEEDQNKIIQKLLAKGYSYSDIKKFISEIEE
jgi:SOS response regulatory protein OraA/RecX